MHGDPENRNLVTPDRPDERASMVQRACRVQRQVFVQSVRHAWHREVRRLRLAIRSACGMNRSGAVILSAVLMLSVAASCSRMDNSSIARTGRLIVPSNEILEADVFEGLEFSGTFSLETHGEPVLLTDPIYLADIYNLKDDERATYIRKHGVLLVDFGGDIGSPVWWQPPYLRMPISAHYEDKSAPTRGAQVLADEVRCDSGSFVFLPVTDQMPASLKREVERVVREGDGALLSLPTGRYSFFYEQFDAPEPNMAAMYRNIVARKD